MAIKGLYDVKPGEREAAPIGIIKIGVLTPAGCKNAVIYAESPETNKCTNEQDGPCPFMKKTALFPHYVVNDMGKFKKDMKESTCPGAKCTIAACKKKGHATSPAKLPFFLMPDELREALNLPLRPTEIPGVQFLSNEVTIERDPNGRITAIYEPEDVAERYPITNAGLFMWTQNDLCCTGDGEKATWYPASPNNPKYQQERVCEYKNCPDFKAGKCTEVGEMFFLIPNAPGFPGRWSIKTKSMKAMKGVVKELKQYQKGYQGRISLMPMKLQLRKEKASPEVNRKVNGEWMKVKTSTDVFRVHAIPSTTMDTAIAALGPAMQFLTGGIGDGYVKSLQEAAPLSLPSPAEPIDEAVATAPKEDWDSANFDHDGVEDAEYEDVQTDQNIEPAPEPPKQAPKAAPAAPAQPKQQPPYEIPCVACGDSGKASNGGVCASCMGRGTTVRKTPTVPVGQASGKTYSESTEPAPTTTPAAPPAVDEKAAKMQLAAELEAGLIEILSQCRSKAEVKLFLDKHGNDFREPVNYIAAGFKPLKLKAAKEAMLAKLPDYATKAKAPAAPKDDPTAGLVSPLTTKRKALLDMIKNGDLGMDNPVAVVFEVINAKHQADKNPVIVNAIEELTEQDFDDLFKAING